jgi:TPR repeat protein
MVTSLGPILARRQKGPWQTFLHLSRDDQGFRGFLEFALMGAVVLCFLHGVDFRGFRPPATAPSPVRAPQSNALKGSRLPVIRDVMFDAGYFAGHPEPARSTLIDATAAIKANDLGRVDRLLAGTNADDPSVLLVRGTVAIASPDPRVAARGVELLKQSAARGDAKAMSLLGIIMSVGLAGQSRNADLGRQYLQQAAYAGDAKAAYVLGSGYVSGWAGRIDLAAAAPLIRRAAERGDAEAMFQYALMVIQGLGVAKDTTEGETWLLRAAELGHPSAQSEFGSARLSDYLRQLTSDAEPAIRWLSRAVDQGDASAMFTLGAFYQGAKPVTGYYAPERGAQLMKMCSEQTLDPRCAFAYATLLETGHGTPIDLVQAYGFYHLAEDIKKTPSGTERLADLEKQLSVHDLKKGRELAQQVRERYFVLSLPRVARSWQPVYSGEAHTETSIEPNPKPSE